ncbi:MAG: hypothetical protein WA971_13475 [Microbacterium sp.]
MADGAPGEDGERQHVVRVPGSRRAKLTAAPGTTAAPDTPDAEEPGPPASGASQGPNDERLRREVPPHY